VIGFVNGRHGLLIPVVMVFGQGSKLPLSDQGGSYIDVRPWSSSI